MPKRYGAAEGMSLPEKSDRFFRCVAMGDEDWLLKIGY
jgi:hypothetical protein